MKRFLSPLALLALAVGAFGVAHAPASAQSTATPPPSPPPLNMPTATPGAPAPVATDVPPPGNALPTPASSSAGATLTPKGKPTPTPPPDTVQDPHRVGISGVWEVQIQRDSQTQYTHFKLDQNQSVLTGQYLDSDGKKYPLAGSVDGKQVRIIVSLPSGGTVTFTGSVDGTSDMLGMMQSPKESVAFTASYRPKYKWLDNISPNPGLGP
ncbi:MAG: hypothetical protein ACXWNK_12335 [Vulcanimicrobiaceae bacterium]